MSIQWTFLAGYLYFEASVVALMMLPVASPRRWQQFFRSRLFAWFSRHAVFYFYVILGVLGLFLMDSVREIRKYSHSDSTRLRLSTEMKGDVKLFRAQRNFYITGFSIFLAFVIRRLVTMILLQAEFLDRAERLVREAETAKDFAKSAVIAHTLKSAGDAENDIHNLEDLLQSEKNKVFNLEAEMAALKIQLSKCSCNLSEEKSE